MGVRRASVPLFAKAFAEASPGRDRAMRANIGA
jgi:hypothetical protein